MNPKRWLCIPCVAASLFSSSAMAAVPSEVAAGLAEARRVAGLGDELWPAFSAAPFGLLLVQESGETLLCDKRVPDGFTPAPVLGQLANCSVATGPRSWRQPSLRAAMPVFGPGEVIVIGTPAATGLDVQSWRRTIIHEHFHQWQGELPDIYKRIEALGLAGGDQTGMWMLNYPFPYDRPEVGLAFRAAAEALISAIQAPPHDLRNKAQAYLAARHAFQISLSAADWRYFDFQLWKEGVARWTEIEIARRANGPWRAGAVIGWRQTLEDLRQANLAEQKRVTVYAFGAAEAALLERLDPDWRGCYRAVTTLTPCWDGLRMKIGSR